VPGERIQSLIADRSKAIQRTEVRIKEIEKSILRKYGIHKSLFAFGLTLLVLARGYPPLAAIVSNIWQSSSLKNAR